MLQEIQEFMVYVGRKTINLWKPKNISGEQKDFLQSSAAGLQHMDGR